MQKTTLTVSQPSLPFASKAPQGVQWQQTVVMRNAQEQEEAFSIGPDGQVWSFISDGGEPRLENLGLEADFLTVGRNMAGALVLIAAKGLRTQYRTEIPLTARDAARGLSSCWSPAQSIHLPSIPGATGVRRLYTQSDFSGMRIAMIVDTGPSDVGTSYVIACSQWHETGPGPFILLPPLNVPVANRSRKPASNTGLSLFRIGHSA